MTKKDFKASVSPADIFITGASTPEPVKADLPRGQRETKTKKVSKEPAGKPKETKSKRLNLLIQPSVIEDLNKIATMQKDSVNNLINSALIEYRDAHRDLIERYNKVFEG